jgi:hypothetical protein
MAGYTRPTGPTSAQTVESQSHMPDQQAKASRPVEKEAGVRRCGSP